MARTINRIAGYQGFTVCGSEIEDKNGYVDWVQFGIDFDTIVDKVSVVVNPKDYVFGAKFGDGTIIRLKNPTVIASNIGSAVIQFKMEKTYPSNSPCMLVYCTDEAYISITEIN